MTDIRRCLLIGCLCLTGCDPIYWVRVDVREGNLEAMKVERVSNVQCLAARPVAGVRVEVWELKRDGERRWEKVGHTDEGGSVDVPPDMCFGPWLIRCTKEGYDPVEGAIPVRRFWGRTTRTLLVHMRRSEPGEP